jgi:hypothetical protein
MEKRMLWEYKVIAVGSLLRGAKGEQIEARLNELGLEGWEVIAVELPHNGGKLIAIAKRPLNSAERRQRRDWPSPTVAAQ